MQSVELVGRLLVSLLAVLTVVWLIGRKLRKGGRLKDSKLIDVLGRQQLSRNASVAVVRIGDQALIIGVSETQVNVLGHTDLAAAQAAVSSLRTVSAEAPVTHRRAGARRAAVPMSSVPMTMPTPAPAGAPLPGPTAVRTVPVDPTVPAPASPLAGSALSPQTWRQTVESLRQLTSR